MKKYRYACILIVIMLFVSGCAAPFKERRDISRPLVDLALEKLRNKNIQAALVDLRKARDANPEDPEVYYTFALAYWSTNKYQKTLNYLDKAIEYSDRLELERPGMASKAYNLKGVVLFQEGKKDQAVLAFKKALEDELYPTPEYPLYNLGEVYISEGKLDEAKKFLDQAIKHNYHYAPAWEALARVYMARKDTPSAINSLRHAILEFPAFTSAHLELASLYLETGDTQDAVKHLKKVVELDRSGPLGRIARKRLERLGVKP